MEPVIERPALPLDLHGLVQVLTTICQQYGQRINRLILGPHYPITDAERAAGVTPVDYRYPELNVLRYGTNTTPGTTDMTAAFRAAIAVAKVSRNPVIVPAGLYLVTDTLVVDFEGFTLRGAGGLLRQTEIKSGALSGPVLWLRQRSPTITGIAISSTPERFAAAVSDGHGILRADLDAPVVSFGSRHHLQDIYIINQPTDGFHSIGGCEMSWYENVTVADCKRHGFVWDDGTVAGYTNISPVKPFHFGGENLRAIECGGHAFVLGNPTGGSPFHFFGKNIEALGCTWDATKRIGGLHYQFLHNTHGGFIQGLDIEDQQYAETVTSSTGVPRTALAAPSSGIRFTRGRVTLQNPYFSSLVKSVDANVTGVRVISPVIFAGAYGVVQDLAIDFGSADACYAEVNTADCTGADQIVRAQSRHTRYFLDGDEYQGLPLTTVDWRVSLKPIAGEIASGTLTLVSSRMVVNGEGGIADSLNNLRLAPGHDGFDALEVMLVWDGVADITITSGVGNTLTKSGESILLNASRPVIRFAYSEAVAAWVEV